MKITIPSKVKSRRPPTALPQAKSSRVEYPAKERKDVRGTDVIFALKGKQLWLTVLLTDPEITWCVPVPLRAVRPS